MSSQVADRPRIGTLLRDWRVRRRMSQQDLALEAGVSARHVSFVETGRSKPSADMVIQLAEHLEVPLRDRNTLLLAAGFAPAYAQRDLDEPEMGPVRQAIDRVLRGHEPYPAVVVDRHWGLVAANRAVPLLIGGAADHLLEPPVNVLRLSLHPEGMAPRIVNLGEWRAHLLDRLGRQAVVSGDPALFALHEELAGYPRNCVTFVSTAVSRMSCITGPMTGNAMRVGTRGISRRARWKSTPDSTTSRISAAPLPVRALRARRAPRSSRPCSAGRRRRESGAPR